VLLAGLIGAILWNILAWWWGLPTSSSHALIGGYGGAALARAAALTDVFRSPGHHRLRLDEDAHLHRGGTLNGFVLGFGMMVAVSGGDDAQKPMGIVAGPLYTACVMSKTDFTANWGNWHWPIILAAHAAIALGSSRRLANRPYDEIEDHQAKTRRRLLRRNCPCHHALRHSSSRHSRQHYSHHYRPIVVRHLSLIRGALGSRHPYRLGMDLHHTRIRFGGDVQFLAYSPLQSVGVGKCSKLRSFSLAACERLTLDDEQSIGYLR